MKLLLDTHIWIWSLMDPTRLPPRMRRALASAKAELWLSPISVWEAHLAIESRRLRTKMAPHEWVQNALAATPLKAAHVTHEVAIESRRLGLSHQDPGDRFIAATAAVYGLTLATTDKRLLHGKGYDVLAG
jgi:PIN domain nuclease of toxin-antitoxin system